MGVERSSYIPGVYRYLVKFRFGKPLLLVIPVISLVAILVTLYACVSILSHYIMAFTGLADPVSVCHERSPTYKLKGSVKPLITVMWRGNPPKLRGVS